MSEFSTLNGVKEGFIGKRTGRRQHLFALKVNSIHLSLFALFISST